MTKTKMRQVLSAQISLLLLMAGGITDTFFFTNGCPAPSLDFDNGRRSEKPNDIVLNYTGYTPQTIRFYVTSNCYNLSDIAFYVLRHFPLSKPSWRLWCKLGIVLQTKDCQCTLNHDRMSCDIELTFQDGNTQRYRLREINDRTEETKFVVIFKESDNATDTTTSNNTTSTTSITSTSSNPCTTSTPTTSDTTQRKMALATTDSFVLGASESSLPPSDATSAKPGEMVLPATTDSQTLRASESRLSSEGGLTSMVPLWVVLVVVSAIIVIGIVVIVVVKRRRISALPAVTVRYRDARPSHENEYSDTDTGTYTGLVQAGRGARPETVYDLISDNAAQPSSSQTARRAEESQSGRGGQRLGHALPSSSALMAGLVLTPDNSATRGLTTADRNSMETGYLRVLEPETLHNQSWKPISALPGADLKPTANVKSPPLPVRKYHTLAPTADEFIAVPQENRQPYSASNSQSAAEDCEVVSYGSPIAQPRAEICPTPSSPHHCYESLRRNTSKRFVPLVQTSEIPPSHDSASYLHAICHEPVVSAYSQDTDLSRSGSDEMLIVLGPGHGKRKPQESQAQTICVPLLRQHSTSSETSEIQLSPTNVLLIKFESPLQSPVSIVARPAWDNLGYAVSPLAGDQDH